MELKLNNEYFGFKLKKEEYIKESKSKGFIFEHIKTGARLIYLKNKDKNRVFSIAFKTLPLDNMGSAHILEHSVLCGSKKYNLKDPFAYLLKSSITTFLNAFTFPDKTVYPVATNNSAEFSKLMDIYLDAVFYPNLLNNKNIFLQEGWRFELENKNDNLKYSGVVYGEMKGVFSSPISTIHRKSSQVLFPNNSYSFDSGGDPEKIVDLTYEKLCDFHKKYYNPTNSYIYLYGDLDILEKLKYLDEQYLSKFEKQEISNTIEDQKPFEKEVEISFDYPISKNEKDIKNKLIYNKSFVISNSLNTKDILGFKILNDILFSMSSSPLKQYLLKQDLGDDVYSSFDSEFKQPIFSIFLQNSNIENKDKFKTFLNSKLNELSKGIDKDLIEAAINNNEFELKENISEFNCIGIDYFVSILTTFLHYEKDEFLGLKYLNDLNEIKNSIQDNYFEDLIKKYLIENKHSTFISLIPNSDIDVEKNFTDKLKKIQSTLSDEQKEDLIEQTKQVRKFQEDEDTDEEKSKIKIIKLDQIEEKEELNLSLIENKENVKFLSFKDIEEKKELESDIFYLNFYFDSSFVDKKDISYIHLLAQVLDEVKTKNYSYEDFSNLINNNFGEINFSSDVLEDINNNKILFPKFIISSKFLKSNKNKVINIFNEYFNEVVFEKDKIKQIIDQIKAYLEVDVISSGHKYSMGEVVSNLSNLGKSKSLINGIDFYNFIKNLSDNFEENFDTIKYKLNFIYNNIFNKNNLILSSVEDLEVEDFQKLKLTNKNLNYNKYDFKLSNKSVALTVQSQINYVSEGFSLNSLSNNNLKYNGIFEVLKTILRYDYLWENVRVIGGAYGSFAQFTKSGLVVFGSYRDPNILSTFNVYENFYKYLKNLDLTEIELRKFIIGTISSWDLPLSTQDLLTRKTNEFISNISEGFLKKTRDEILNCKVKDLKNLSSIFEQGFKNSSKSVVGNETQINKNKDEFDSTMRL